MRARRKAEGKLKSRTRILVKLPRRCHHRGLLGGPPGVKSPEPPFPPTSLCTLANLDMVAKYCGRIAKYDFTQYF